MKSLYCFLEEMDDHRRDQGVRFRLPSMLTMIIIGYLGGNQSGKALGRFFKNNEEDLVKLLGLSHGVPCATRINTFLKEINFKKLNDVFRKWMEQYDQPGDWISIDGKALRSTFTGYESCEQNFQAMISVFSQTLGVNKFYGTYENKKENEPAKVIELLELLQNKGFTIVLDAVHFQKKLSKRSWSQEMTF